MSAAPYPEFQVQKIKLAMALRDKGYYRLSQIQPRHFYQTGQKAGLREQDMDSIFSDLAARMEKAIADAALWPKMPACRNQRQVRFSPAYTSGPH